MLRCTWPFPRFEPDNKPCKLHCWLQVGKVGARLNELCFRAESIVRLYGSLRSESTESLAIDSRSTTKSRFGASYCHNLTRANNWVRGNNFSLSVRGLSLALTLGCSGHSSSNIHNEPCKILCVCKLVLSSKTLLSRYRRGSTPQGDILFPYGALQGIPNPGRLLSLSYHRDLQIQKALKWKLVTRDLEH